MFCDAFDELLETTILNVDLLPFRYRVFVEVACELHGVVVVLAATLLARRCSFGASLLRRQSLEVVRGDGDGSHVVIICGYVDTWMQS